MKNNSKILTWGGYLAITLLLALIVSVITVRAGLWQQGLVLYALSCAGAAALLLVFIICLPLPGFSGLRRPLLIRALAVLPGTVLLLSLLGGGKYPEIHDITTDITDPPIFVQAAKIREDSANSLEISPDTLQLQSTAYPGLKTMQSHLDFDQAYAQASTVAKKMGWKITASDPEAGTIEAIDTTSIMGFKDDIIIRLRPAESGTLIDLRSASRVGRSDLGANARRIREFMARYKS